MQYFGGKHRIAARIADIIAPFARDFECYVEPFVGAANVMARVRVPCRIGADANEALITMWRMLAAGWEPPRVVSKEMYESIRALRDPGDPLTAFIGFGASFGAKWFGSYARSRGFNFAAMACESLRVKCRGLIGVRWVAADYRECPTPGRSIIYCDPPYMGATNAYGVAAPFRHSEFWDWCRQKHEEGHAVFVSEYSAPETFTPILSIPMKPSVRTKVREWRHEKLFVPGNCSYGYPTDLFDCR